MDCYILHTILVVAILILLIGIICYHYAKHRSKQILAHLHYKKWRKMMATKCFNSIIMSRFGKTKVAKEEN